jgi:hypothetical protein
MTNEEIISEFLRAAYTDERLAMLLAHCEDGKLVHQSCCCVLGIPTADHALRGRTTEWRQSHYFKASDRFGTEAGVAFVRLAETDAERRTKLIPLVHAEIKRRDEIALAESAEKVFQTVRS